MPQSTRTPRTYLWVSVLFLVQVAESPVAQAEFTFFSSRADWEAEANNRGLLVAEEDFDAFADDGIIPSFTIGDIQFTTTNWSGQVQDGMLTPSLGAALRFGYLTTEFEILDAGTIDGPLGGVGIELDVESGTNRELRLLDRPANVLEAESYLEDGFIGVLFDSEREAEAFFVISSRDGITTSLSGADNLVVASFPVPEPSTLILAATAVLALGFLRRRATQ